MRRAWFFTIATLVYSVCPAEDHSITIRQGAVDPVMLSGNLRVDLTGLERLGGPPAKQDKEIEVEGEKSVWLAAGLSAIIPGAGEIYAESYLKGSIFFLADVALWGLAYHFDKKGDDQTDFFQGYADQHWNVVRYADFAETHFISSGSYAWRIPGAPNDAPPWQRVNWDELNRMERDIARTAAGQYYSHTLPRYGEQQYFELIGKYQQFYQGWDDANLNLVSYDEITAALTDDTMFKYYSAERGKANDYYSNATTFVTIAVINHVLSAADAAWTAGRYNSALRANVGLQSIPIGTTYVHNPSVMMKYSF